MPNRSRFGSSLEETAEHTFYFCERVHPFWNHVGEWTARIESKQLVLLDICYVGDNILPQFQGEKRVVFLAILGDVNIVYTQDCICSTNKRIQLCITLPSRYFRLAT